MVFVASQCAFGVEVSDRLESDPGGVSVWGEEDGAVGGADGPGRRSQDGVAERRTLQEVMVWMRCGRSSTESEGVRRRCGGHCCGNSQGARQEPCTQSFGEILGEGQRRRQISSPVLLVSAEERVRLARHAVPVPST